MSTTPLIERIPQMSVKAGDKACSLALMLDRQGASSEAIALCHEVVNGLSGIYFASNLALDEQGRETPETPDKEWMDD